MPPAWSTIGYWRVKVHLTSCSEKVYHQFVQSYVMWNIRRFDCQMVCVLTLAIICLMELAARGDVYSVFVDMSAGYDAGYDGKGYDVRDVFKCMLGAQSLISNLINVSKVSQAITCESLASIW